MIKNITIITALFILLTTSSCGFTVLYDKKDANLEYEKELASIRIQQDSGITSQELRSNIYDSLNPNNIKEEVKYYLILKYTEGFTSAFLTSRGASGKNRIVMTLNYELKSYKNDRLVALGIVKSDESYNINPNRYGNYTAEQFARSNLLKSISEKLRNALVQDLIDIKEGNGIADKEYEEKNPSKNSSENKNTSEYDEY